MTMLTQDELTVLLIADQGESMIPIGIWAEPIKSLHAKGFLHKYDDVNYGITPEGRQAARDGETKNLQAVVDTRNVINIAHNKSQETALAIARMLADLAIVSSHATGDNRAQALRNWSKVVLDKAKKLIA